MGAIIYVDLEDVDYVRFEQMLKVRVVALAEVVSPYVPERIASDPNDSWPAEGPEIELSRWEPISISFVADNGDMVSIVTKEERLPEEIREALLACATERYMSGDFEMGDDL